MASLSIVVPAYNEEQRLPQTIEKLSSFANQHSWDFLEILIVNDGSGDRTATIVSAQAQADPRFRLVENPGNRGKGYAVRNGMLSAKGAWRLMTDADLSTPIEEALRLLEIAQQRQAAVVIGSRALDRSMITKHQSLFREYGGRLYNLMMKICTGLPFVDTQCGFKLYRADAAEASFSRQRLDGFSFDAEALFIAQKHGFPILEVPVPWANAEGTKVTVGGTAKAFFDLMEIRKNSLKGLYN